MLQLNRLQGETQGRLEIYWDGEWASFCSNGPNQKLPNTICELVGLKLVS